MNRFIKLCKTLSPEVTLNVRRCDTFFTRLVGLMGCKELEENGGILLVQKKESRLDSAIHMLFMNSDITVLWLDKDMVIVDKRLARKWHLVYIPRKPSKFVLEIHKDVFNHFDIGDRLVMT